MIKLLLLIGLTSLLSAKYTNCEFQNRDYIDICKKVVKNGVSHNYANKFLLSYFKTQKFDEITWKYMQPRHIKTHRKSEKKANNVLVKQVPKMVSHLNEYKKVYDKAEKKYGVNREIIAAILLKETKLGKIKPTHDAFIVFNTLVVRTNPKTTREKWLLKMGKTNMASIITHCYKKGVTPEQCNLPSSYAGAIGIPQFMPKRYVHAESYNGKAIDLTKIQDAIMSAAKFLHKKANFDTLINWDKMPNIPEIEAQWYEYEFKYENSSFVYEKSKSGKVYNCFTAGRDDLKYLRDYAKKIMRYNNSSNYSVGVMRLAYDAYYLGKRK